MMENEKVQSGGVMIAMTMEELEQHLRTVIGGDISQSSDRQVYEGLLTITKNLLIGWKNNSGKRKLYYISAEFLIGKLLSNNLINLGIYDLVAAMLAKNGKNITAIEEIEPEPSLGNGGLGRLAACYMDSIATLGLNGEGLGLNYHLGLFRQQFAENKQKEYPDPWIQEKNWLLPCDEHFTVTFKNLCVQAKPYELKVSGYGKEPISLKLFDLDTVDESIVKDGITFDQTDIARNLTLFLYPDDSTKEGRLLRIYQEYFLVSASAQLIIKEALDRGSNIHNLADYVVIQINDTHPAMIIPEMIRILVRNSIAEEEAIRIVSSMCAYTNHTILAEALETWPLEYLEEVVPDLVSVIRTLDRKVKEQYPDPDIAIIDEKGRVHMAYMAIHYGFSINGVAALHTDILKTSELDKFYELYQERFNNKTNGITFRRWLVHCNRPLTQLITSLIGDGFVKNGEELEKLISYKENAKVLETIRAIKLSQKEELAEYLGKTQNVNLNTNSIYDIQIKRLHEYKRQQLNALYIIYKYMQIKEGNYPKRPITFLFGAKAAPAYTIAKDIIHLILCLQQLIDEDPQVAPHLKVVMLQNYNVTLAEKVIPACDVSEQISLASKEASGTGNMKLMLNGAVTLGTMDGANVEIHNLVGEDNIYIFGADSEEVIQHYEKKDYDAKGCYVYNEDIGDLVDFIISEPMLRIGCKENLRRLHVELASKDWFMTLLDLKDYIKVKEKMFADYENQEEWSKKALTNIAMAGFFSSDRAISQYNQDIWHL